MDIDRLKEIFLENLDFQEYIDNENKGIIKTDFLRWYYWELNSETAKDDIVNHIVEDFIKLLNGEKSSDD